MGVARAPVAGSGAAPACSASVSKRVADIVGGGATSGLAKGESGGHPIMGMADFKRGFPEARVRAVRIALRERPPSLGGRAAFLLWAFPLGSKIIHAVPALLVSRRQSCESA